MGSYRHGNTPTVRSPVAPRTLYGLRQLLYVCVCRITDGVSLHAQIQSIHSLIIHSPLDVLLDQLHPPGLCDHPPGLLRVEPHTLNHTVADGEGEIVKYSGTSKQDF